MPKTLLLADDSVVIQKLVGLSFANEDVDLVTTDNGDDAVAKARECLPDVVLADVVMPGMSGYEVCEAIKNDPQLAGTPVLLLTGTFEAFDEARARQVGSDGHITKPFEAQVLVDRVNELLTRGRVPAAAPSPAANDDFFDGGVGTDSAVGRNVTRAATTSAPSTAPAADDGGPSPLAPPVAPPANSNSFDFGVEENLPPLGTSDLLGDAPAAPSPSDNTVAMMPEDNTPTQSVQQSPTLTHTTNATDPLVASTPPESPPVATSPEPETWSERTDDPLSLTPPGGDPFVGAESPAAPRDPSLTTVIMSGGDSDSDAVQLDTDPASVHSFNDDLMGANPAPLGTPEPAAAPAAPDTALLADDLFASDPAIPARPTSGGSDSSDAFDFGTADPLAESASDLMNPPSPPPAASDPLDSPPPIASNYDVSTSELLDPLQAPAATRPDPDILSNEPSAEPTQLAEPMQAPEPTPEATATPDISPVMRQRIHETLERVAWEAFADLSETMVKQVLERVESIAWEVVPQMAEALVKEEIRRMKGEDES